MPRNIRWLSCIALALCIVLADKVRAQKVLYWTDKDAPRIHRMNADGSGGIQTLLGFSNGISDPRGIVLHPAAGKMYFSDAVNRSIHRANLDGTNVENLITAGQVQPADMAIDLAGGHLYWSDTAEGTINGAIRRSDLNGNNIVTLRSNLAEPYFITLDTPGGKIYWSDFNSGLIHRANLDGSGDVEHLVIGLMRVRDLVIDGGYMYWADRNARKIQRRLVGGGPVEDLFDANDGLLRPHGLVLDTEAGYIYWTDTDAHAVGRGNINGSGLPLYLATGNDGQVGPWAITLVVPEPGAAMIFAACGACGLLHRRCKRSARFPSRRG